MDLNDDARGFGSLADKLRSAFRHSGIAWHCIDHVACSSASHYIFGDSCINCIEISVGFIKRIVAKHLYTFGDVRDGWVCTGANPDFGCF